MKDVEKQEFLTVEEFAKSSTLSKMTIRRMMRKGKLASIQPAGPKGKWLIPRKALEDLTIQAFDRVKTTGDSARINTQSSIPGKKPGWKN